jgi:SAM-dependent methyltransferase
VFGGGRLLDFGCGAGQQLQEASTKGWEVTGVDYSKEALAHAKRNAPSANVWQGGMEVIPDDEIFDCVTAFHVLEHLENPAAWLESVHRRMAPNGILRIEVPVPCAFMHSIFKGLYYPYDVPRHFSVPSPRGLDILLRASGFQPISQTPILFPTCLSESIDRSFQALFRVRVRSDIRRLNYLASIGPMALLSAMGMVCVLSIDSRKL